MKEQEYDDKLHIQTVGIQEDSPSSSYYHHYEPTPYAALEQLFAHYVLNSNDVVVDYGCGKGRLNFYIHHRFQASVIGIEMNERFYHAALTNKESYMGSMPSRSMEIEFHCCLAEQYQVVPGANKFYFFNPFSLPIFIKVVNNILDAVGVQSAELESKREIDLILYYPAEQYTYYLDNRTPFELQQEIKLPDLYERDTAERFVIYRLITY